MKVNLKQLRKEAKAAKKRAALRVYEGYDMFIRPDKLLAICSALIDAVKALEETHHHGSHEQRVRVLTDIKSKVEFT